MRSRARRAPGALALLAGFALLSSGPNCSGPGDFFEEVTAGAGIAHVGSSFGLAWGDLDGDGLPDLFASNHGEPPSLWWNQGDGSFVDLGPALLGADAGDVHAPSWMDFDGDGDLDLLEVVGRAGAANEAHPNRLWVNQAGALLDQAAALGVDLPNARGRTASWLDWNQDGWLDLTLHNVPAGGDASDLYLNQGDAFVASGLLPESNGGRAPAFAQMGDLDDDGALEMISFGTPVASKIYELESGGFTEVDLGLPNLAQPRDAIIADLDGDLSMDLFVVRAGGTYSQIVPGPENRLRALLRVQAGEHGFDFRSDGPVDFELDWWNLPPSWVRIGAAGAAPPGPRLAFTLDPEDTAHHGLAPHVAGADTGIYLGYDPIGELWQVRFSSLDWKEARLQVEASGPIDAWQPVGIPDPPPAPQQACEAVPQPCRSDKLFLSRDGLLVDHTEQAGLDLATECESVAAGDFDNDTDVDLYLVCTGPAANLENRLYWNLGNAAFVVAPRASGAAGSLEGRGEAVAVADFDLDGFLDLAVMNGDSAPPLNAGPHQLFRNRGNGNHWLEIDLEATASHRQALGAHVYVTAGGKTQVRAQTDGLHSRAQDHLRIHFGLGSHAVIDELLVSWPSGSSQRYESVAADRLVRIVEGPDADADGVVDAQDDCTLVADGPFAGATDQRDSDADGFGDACDCDFDQSGTCDAADWTVFMEDLQTGLDRGVGTDMNGDGTVDAEDEALFSAVFATGLPGPSGLVPSAP